MPIMITNDKRVAKSTNGWDIQILANNGRWVSVAYFSTLHGALRSSFEKHLSVAGRTKVSILDTEKYLIEQIDNYIKGLTEVK